MANPEHLEKLQEGVEAWNRWRKDNPGIRPDLSYALFIRANLNDANLSYANLSYADLSYADLSYANLSYADLSVANLSYADLNGANLRSVNLYDADLRDANLSDSDLSDADIYDANLDGAKLSGANIYDANLDGAKLSGARLDGARLGGANLSGAYLYNANLSDANLYDANLSDANLSSANLRGAYLYNANLSDANLSSANLRGADLIRTQALNTNFEGANFTGACIEDWNINSKTNLENVQCDYIFLKWTYLKDEKRWGQSDRVPHDPDKIFAPGEFTKRYQKILETVDLYFGERIDWQVFLQSFQKLQEEEKLKIQNGNNIISTVQGIKNTGDGSFVIEIGVSPDTDKGEWEKSFWQQYQPMLEAQEEKYKLLLHAKNEQINQYFQQNTQLMRIVELQANQQIQIVNNLNNQQGNKNMNKKETKIDKCFNTKQAGIVYNEGEISGNAKVAAVINEAASQDLSQAAGEIQNLLNQLEKDNPTETNAQKGAIADIATGEIVNNQDQWEKVIKVIKAMGIEAIAEAVDHPIFNVAKAGIETALEKSS